MKPRKKTALAAGAVALVLGGGMSAAAISQDNRPSTGLAGMPSNKQDVRVVEDENGQQVEQIRLCDLGHPPTCRWIDNVVPPEREEREHRRGSSTLNVKTGEIITKVSRPGPEPGQTTICVTSDNPPTCKVIETDTRGRQVVISTAEPEPED